MTISSAFQNAMSGLRAASRATDVIATNISNATTEGYARRVLDVSATTRSNLGGVTVNGVSRVTDPALTSARRNAEADFGHSRTIKNFATGLENALGTPDDPSALTNVIADFEASLLTAAGQSESTEFLAVAVENAKSIIASFQKAGDAIANLRSDAESSIDSQVTQLNDALEELTYLNTQIAKTNIGGRDSSGLSDLRQTLVDEIHTIVPVQIAARDNGKIALYSQGGMILHDGTAVSFEFDPAHRVTAYQTHAGGQLSGLTANDIDVRIGSSNSSIPGGTLAAQFAIRDELGTEAQTQIDAAARNLIERFQDPSLDATLSPTDAGLFTDNGVFFDVTNEVGIANRLSLNAAVDPDQSGETWRLRDGLGAPTEGTLGNSSLLRALRESLNAPLLPASGDFGGSAQSIAELSSSLMGHIGVQRLSAEQNLSFAAASFNITAQAEREFGVDTDSELQMLMLVEQSYAANARMLATIDEMMDTLMRIGA